MYWNQVLFQDHLVLDNAATESGETWVYTESAYFSSGGCMENPPQPWRGWTWEWTQTFLAWLTHVVKTIWVRNQGGLK
jgi:hypothetical protein